MERLTFEGRFCDIAKCTSVPGGSFCESGHCSQRKVWERLKAYEDIGADPEEISVQLEILRRYSEAAYGIGLKRLRELAKAEKDGRLVVLGEPRKPLVWGDDAHDTVLCPNCNHDLMGGFPEGESCEMPMYQCPYCGQPIDDEKALTRQEAEASLKEEKQNGKD